MDNSRDDRGFSESALALAANADIVAMMRIEPPMGTNLWVARSSDHGKTWSKADGALVTVHYLTRESLTGVEATRWAHPWK